MLVNLLEQTVSGVKHFVYIVNFLRMKAQLTLDDAVEMHQASVVIAASNSQVESIARKVVKLVNINPIPPLATIS